jgi:uncharacterized protein
MMIFGGQLGSIRAGVIRSVNAIGITGAMMLAGCAPTYDVAPGNSAQTALNEPAEQNVAPSSAGFNTDFVARIVGDTEDVWDALFRSMGMSSYPRPVVVIFSKQAHSACGNVIAAAMPFYCLFDRRIYVDTAFLSELSRRWDATGDFVAGLLIAREVGHHVQNVLGTIRQVDAAMSRREEEQRKQSRVLIELQADCYAGIWVHFVQERNLLEPRDLEEGVRAALAVGDTSTRADIAQRMRWFKRGLETGDPRRCDVPGLPTVTTGERR